MTLTSSRTIQYIIILLILTTIAGGVYHYFNVRAAKINASQTALNTNGLVGYWTFDGADTPWTSSSAATTLDKSGNNNTGTLTNMSQSTSPAIGKIGQALYFDGSNDYVSTTLTSGKIFTWSAWFKSASVVTACGYQSIITIPGASYMLMDVCNSAGSFWSSDGMGGTNLLVTGLTNNTWYHLVLMREGDSITGGYKAYLNGVYKGQANTGIWSSADVIRIGNRSDVAQPFNGTIDDVRIYNRALSAGEVADLYTMGTATVNASTNALNANGLVGQWSFDGKQTVWTSSTAATTLDTSGNNNTGTLTNMSQSTSPTIGKIGQGLKFDGTHYVSASPSPFTSNTSGTITAWIKSTNGGANTTIFNLATPASANYFMYFYGGYPNGKLGIRIKGNGSDIISCGVTDGGTSAQVTASGLWTFVVITNDASTGKKFYKNGSVQGNDCGSDTNWINSLSAQPPTEADIGIEHLSGVFTNGFIGFIDDVRIYNRALSAAEVADLYTMGTTTVNAATNALNASGLAGQWSFDGKQTVWTSSTAATTLDTSGNNNTGTLTSMSQSTSPIIGKIGQGLYFDGSNDYVNVPDAASLRVGSPNFTFAAWIKPSSVSGCGADLVPNCIVFNKENSYEWAISNTSKINWAIRNTSPGWAWVNSGLTALSGEWTHIVITYNGSNVITYKNGGASTNSQAGSGNVDNTTYQNALRIGARSAPGAATSFFPGSIDDVRIYNRALNANEVASLYNQGR